MQTHVIATWSTKAVTFAVAALAALSGTYWVLKSTQANSVSTAAVVATPGMAPLDPQAIARALGGGVVALAAGSDKAAAQTSYVLVGVIAGGVQGGAALIAVDGKPPKPFRVGAVVDGNLVLQSVVARRATLAAGADGAGQITLELPPLSR